MFTWLWEKISGAFGIFWEFLEYLGTWILKFLGWCGWLLGFLLTWCIVFVEWIRDLFVGYGNTMTQLVGVDLTQPDFPGGSILATANTFLPVDEFFGMTAVFCTLWALALGARGLKLLREWVKG